MSLEDPFFVVKDEVLKAFTKTQGLYDCWKSVQDGTEYRSAEELETAATELKNSLRSIEWDLEDLEDTVKIVEKNPTKFRINGAELAIRKGFIESTKAEVNAMKAKITAAKNSDLNGRLNSPGHVSGPNSTKYSRVPNTDDSPNREHISGSGMMDQQNQLLLAQEDKLDLMGESMGSIRNMSSQIAVELDEQAVMLDEFGDEIEHAESRLDNTVKKMGKILRLTNDRRQLMAIGTISSAILVLLILLFVL